MIKIFLQSIRIKNVIIGIICCLITFLKVPPNNYVNTSFGLLIIVLLMLASNLINDVFDMKTDKINYPNRALIKHPELKKIFIKISFSSFFGACFLAFFINNIAFFIVLVSIPILVSYTPFLKGIALLGNVIISFYLGLVFIFIEICISNSINIMILPASFAFGISLIREITKDIEDYKGDKIANIHTLPVYIGVKKSTYFTCFLMGCFLFFCGYVMFFLDNFYYNIAVFFLVFMPIFYLIFFLVKSPTSKSCSEASTLLKKITILGLIIIYII